jgi:phosphate transport system substrate-binding protein
MHKKLILIVVAGLVAIANAQEVVHKDVLRAAADPTLTSYVPVTHLTGQIASFGTDTMDDLMRAWIKDFTALYPDVKIELQSKASMSVPAALTAGTAQLSPLSREMNRAEVASFQSKYGYPPVPVVAITRICDSLIWGKRCESSMLAHCRDRFSEFFRFVLFFSPVPSAMIASMHRTKVRQQRSTCKARSTLRWPTRKQSLLWATLASLCSLRG